MLIMSVVKETNRPTLITCTSTVEPVPVYNNRPASSRSTNGPELVPRSVLLLTTIKCTTGVDMNNFLQPT